mmetsp:Transcript_94980/g.245347  ORF Transcript_94980/g.245347 Transcript_94980/m.245347 type:complete len:218 (-) Transcript_94980:407-1060(-)
MGRGRCVGKAVLGIGGRQGCQDRKLRDPFCGESCSRGLRLGAARTPASCSSRVEEQSVALHAQLLCDERVVAIRVAVHLPVVLLLDQELHRCARLSVVRRNAEGTPVGGKLQEVVGVADLLALLKHDVVLGLGHAAGARHGALIRAEAHHDAWRTAASRHACDDGVVGAVLEEVLALLEVFLPLLRAIHRLHGLDGLQHALVLLRNPDELQLSAHAI